MQLTYRNICAICVLCLVLYVAYQAFWVQHEGYDNSVQGVELYPMENYQGDPVTLTTGTYVGGAVTGKSVRVSNGLNVIFDVRDPHPVRYSKQGESYVQDSFGVYALIDGEYREVGEPIVPTTYEFPENASQHSDLYESAGGMVTMRLISKLDATNEDPELKVELFPEKDFQGTPAVFGMSKRARITFLPSINFKSIKIAANRKVNLKCLPDQDMKLYGPLELPKTESINQLLVVLEQVPPPVRSEPSVQKKVMSEEDSEKWFQKKVKKEARELCRAEQREKVKRVRRQKILKEEQAQEAYEDSVEDLASSLADRIRQASYNMSAEEVQQRIVEMTQHVRDAGNAGLSFNQVSELVENLAGQFELEQGQIREKIENNIFNRFRRTPAFQGLSRRIGDVDDFQETVQEFVEDSKDFLAANLPRKEVLVEEERRRMNQEEEQLPQQLDQEWAKSQKEWEEEEQRYLQTQEKESRAFAKAIMDAKQDIRMVPAEEISKSFARAVEEEHSRVDRIEQQIAQEAKMYEEAVQMAQSKARMVEEETARYVRRMEEEARVQFVEEEARLMAPKRSQFVEEEARLMAYKKKIQQAQFDPLYKSFKDQDIANLIDQVVEEAVPPAVSNAVQQVFSSDML